MSLSPTNSPFKLLDPYEKADVSKYFGRTDETRQLAESLLRSKFMLLYGASGTGKTSLIQCGLQGMFSPRDWLPIFVRRGNNFIESIREALLEQYRLRYALRYPGKEVDVPEDLSLQMAIQYLFKVAYVPIYLILDQFEEIFTLGNEVEQQAFFKELAELGLFEEDLFCKLLIVTREEYLAHFYRYEQDLPFLFEYRFRVEKMRQEQLLEVVEGTLRGPYTGYAAFQVEPGTTTQILNNLTDDERGEVDLSTMQVYLDRLYQEDLARQTAQNRNFALFDSALVGAHKLQNVLAAFLDQQVQAANHLLPQKDQYKNLTMQVLFKLVTDQGTKQNRSAVEVHRLLEIGNQGQSQENVQQILEILARPDIRLLNRIKFAKTGEERFELVHDQLAEQVFAKFNGEEQAQREARTTLANKQRRNATTKEFLSRGELELIGKSLNLSSLDRDLRNFYKQSAAYHVKRDRRQRWITLGAVLAAIVFGLVAAGAVYAYNKAAIEALYNKGLVTAKTDPTLARNMILEAMHRDPGNADKIKGYYDLFAHHLFYETLFQAKDTALSNIAFSEDGSLFAVASSWQIKLYETKNALLLDSATPSVAVYSLAFNGNDMLLVGTSGNKLGIYTNLRKPNKGLKSVFFTPTTSNDVVTGIQFSQNRQWFCTTFLNKPELDIWDNIHKKVVKTIYPVQGKITVAALSPDGKWVVTGTSDGALNLVSTQTSEVRPMRAATPGASAIAAITFSPDGTTFLAGTSTGWLYHWKLVNPTQPDLLPYRPQYEFADSTLTSSMGGITHLHYAKDGNLYLVAYQNGTVVVYESKTHATLFELLVKDNQRPCLDIRLTDDQETIYTATADGIIRKWDFPNPFPWIIDIQKEGSATIKFTPDGKKLIVLSRLNDPLIQVYETERFTKIATFNSLPSATGALAVGNTRFACTDDDGAIYVFDLTSNQIAPVMQKTLSNAPVDLISMDAYGKICMGVVQDNLFIWNLDVPVNAGLTWSVPEKGNLITAIGMGSEGGYATVNTDNLVRIYNKNGTLIKAEKITGDIMGVSLLKQERWLAVQIGGDASCYFPVKGDGKPRVLPGIDFMDWLSDVSMYVTGNKSKDLQAMTAGGLLKQIFKTESEFATTSISLHPSGALLVAVNDGGHLMIWRVRHDTFSAPLDAF